MSWDQRVAADAAVSERVAFIRRTYLHVAGAMVAFALLLTALVAYAPPEFMVQNFVRSRMGWLVVFGLYLAVSFIAHRLADARMSPGVQYLGLSIYTVAEAVVFWPLIWYCTSNLRFEGVLVQSVVLTLAMTAGLTLSVFVTKADFSWMRTGLNILLLVAFGLILLSVFGFMSLGIWFAIAMVVLMSACILYETSMVMHHYGTNQHVGAALSIFAAIATLFWYVVQIMMWNRD